MSDLIKTRFEGLITENEFEYVTKELGREPNDFELVLFSATYSEHCSYKHSKELLKLLPREGAIYPDENAGGIRIGAHAILFKMESHNHPCAVEPFNGAATGVGGIIRDVLAMNARPIALCNSLKFGYPKEAKCQMQNAKSNSSHLSPLTSHIINGVVSGISSYGNCIGVPTVSTEVLFDDCYEENPLVNVTAIGIAKYDDILTSNNAKSGLKLMLVGSATMRDGMGGAAFASKELSDEKAEDKISIQIANPFMKKKLIEACLEIFEKKLVVSCQDCGAAGILSSTSEVAYKSACGVEINLDKIHLGDKSIKDYEIMLSETQERMLFVVEEENIAKIEKILNKYQLEYSIIGDTIQEKKYIVKNRQKVLADLPTNLLVNPPEINNVGLVSPTYINHSAIRPLTCSAQDGNCPEIYEQYDHTVGTRTQFQPMICPPPQPSQSVSPTPSLLRLAGSPRRRFASRGEGVEPRFNSLWLHEENCYLGIYTFSAVIEKNPFDEVYNSLINAAKYFEEKGYKPAGITNCLNFANPEFSPTMFEFKETILAIKKACEELNIPVCSGNVSFYNESSSGRIKNTPTFTMLGINQM